MSVTVTRTLSSRSIDMRQSSGGAPTGKAESLPVLLQRRGLVLGIEFRPSDRRIQVLEILLDRCAAILDDGALGQARQRGAQSAHHLDRVGTELADLVEGE